MQPIRDSLPKDWEVVIWDNGAGTVSAVTYSDIGIWRLPEGLMREGMPDLSVYGRYAAIEFASHDLIYTQDDDVIVSDPGEIARTWVRMVEGGGLMADGWIEGWNPSEGVVCNMPPEFRHDFYREHALVGFGAAFHRDAPDRAFMRMANGNLDVAATMAGSRTKADQEFWRRCCDVVFTALTPRVLVDVPKENLPYAEDADRMYRQASHVGERNRMLELALAVRG